MISTLIGERVGQEIYEDILQRLVEHPMTKQEMTFAGISGNGSS